MMQLSSYWCIVDLFEDIQREIARKLLKPRLIAQSSCYRSLSPLGFPNICFLLVKAAADRAGAEKLLKTCLEYEENNEALMQRAT